MDVTDSHANFTRPEGVGRLPCGLLEVREMRVDLVLQYNRGPLTEIVCKKNGVALCKRQQETGVYIIAIANFNEGAYEMRTRI